MLNFSFQSRLAVLLVLAVMQQTLLALTVTSGPGVTVTDTAATIQWKTDSESGTRVSYGLQPESLTKKIEGAVTLDHQVQLSGLQPSTTYYFNFGTARRWLGKGSFTTSGNAGRDQSLPKGETAAAESPISSAPPAKVTWGRLETLQDHFNRHGADVQAKSPEDYASKAWLFLQQARRQELPMKWDATDGTLRVWEPKSRRFAAFDRAGKTRTFFRPSNPDYWNRQPGRLVKPAELPFLKN